MVPLFPLITILGPTAVGKTGFAARLAAERGGEIISADSRQVFRRMDIGTGKDLGDYVVEGRRVPVHLLDIAEPGTEYSVFSFLTDFGQAYRSVVARGLQPILCGGTGLYLDAVLFNYQMPSVPENKELRAQLEELDTDRLVQKLSAFRSLHNTTDLTERARLVRAIEIEEYRQWHPQEGQLPDFSRSPVFGLRYSRQTNRERITLRLRQRLHEGMIDETARLIAGGISAERLMRYGLEYKYVAMYLEGMLTYDEMFRLLNTAIHQFAKRQMTWFRRMEAHGIRIVWLEGEEGMSANLAQAVEMLEKFS